MAKAKESVPQKIAHNASKGAAKSLIDELLQDMHDHRLQIYKMNFVRGLFFAFGSVLGGTVLITLLLWLLSLFNELPVIGHFIDTVQRSIESAKE